MPPLPSHRIKAITATKSYRRLLKDCRLHAQTDGRPHTPGRLHIYPVPNFQLVNLLIFHFLKFLTLL